MGIDFTKRVLATKEMRDVLWLCVKWYEVNPCGGILHVILDDDNVEDYHIDEALNGYASNDPDAIKILSGLKQFTTMHRKWITYNIYNVLAGQGEREIFEETDSDEDIEDEVI